MEKSIKYKTARISYIVSYLLVPLVIFFLSVILLFLENTKWYNIAIAGCLVIICFLLLEPEWERAVREYHITNNEVMEIEGLVRKKRTVIPYQSIADVKVIKGIAGRIFKFGDVVIAGMKESIKMKGMKNPDEIYKIMENKIALQKTGGRRRIESEVEEEKED